MLQYLGFAAVAGGRQYSFSVPGTNVPDRVFTLLVSDARFGPGRLSYQEGPDICYRKLAFALAAESEASPVRAHQEVMESDVAEYKVSGRVKGRVWTEEQRQAARQRFRASPFHSPGRGSRPR